jgi:hypothetical protein
MKDPNNPCPEVKVTSEIKAYFDSRSELGWNKYGTTMDRPDLSPEEWCTHLIDELGDALQYAWRLRADLRENVIKPVINEQFLPTGRMLRPITETRTYHDLNIGDSVFYKRHERELVAAIIAGFVSDPEDGNLIVIQTGYDWVAVQIEELFEEIT